MAFAGARNFLVKALPAKGAVANFHTGQFCAAVLTNRDWKPGPYPKTGKRLVHALKVIGAEKTKHYAGLFLINRYA